MTVLRGKAPGHLPSPAQRAGFSVRSSLGATPRSFDPNEWPPHKWPGRCPFSDLCTIHPARWAGLGKQSGASPLKSVKTTPSWRTSPATQKVLSSSRSSLAAFKTGWYWKHTQTKFYSMPCRRLVQGIRHAKDRSV